MHKQTACFTECFVSPRQNKKLKTSKTIQVFESIIFNVAIRDPIDIEKMRVVKVIQAFIHKRIFIFYQKP